MLARVYKGSNDVLIRQIIINCNQRVGVTPPHPHPGDKRSVTVV